MQKLTNAIAISVFYLPIKSDTYRIVPKRHGNCSLFYRSNEFNGRYPMKKVFVMALVLITGTVLISPAASYGDPYRHGPPGPGPGRPGPGPFIGGFAPFFPGPPPPAYYYGGRYRDYDDGLAIAGIAVGGAILTGIIISALTQPSNTNPNYPPSGSRAYASPDRTSRAPNDPPGEWVTVQGQWVNGKWVPAHKVWVPVNP